MDACLVTRLKFRYHSSIFFVTCARWVTDRGRSSGHLYPRRRESTASFFDPCVLSATPPFRSQGTQHRAPAWNTRRQIYCPANGITETFFKNLLFRSAKHNRSHTTRFSSGRYNVKMSAKWQISRDGTCPLGERLTTTYLAPRNFREKRQKREFLSSIGATANELGWLQMVRDNWSKRLHCNCLVRAEVPLDSEGKLIFHRSLIQLYRRGSSEDKCQVWKQQFLLLVASLRFCSKVNFNS